MMKRLIDWVKEMCIKYKGLILYLIFGVSTTIINLVVYWACYNLLGISNLISNAIAWVAAVIFAYISNKLWVFESKSWNMSVVIPEAAKFFGARVATGLMDEGIMWLGVDALGFNGIYVKIFSNVLVVILNYIFSKFIIFRKNKQ